MGNTTFNTQHTTHGFEQTTHGFQLYQPTFLSNSTNPTNSINSNNPINSTNSTNSTNPINPLKPLTPSQKEKVISRLFWDTEVNPIDAESLIEAHLQNFEDIQSQQFFRKLLTSCDWYTLLKLIPAEKLTAILDDNIINRLFPQDLKMKYKYARTILYR